MADETPEVAHSEAFRRRSPVEAVAAAVGRVVPQGGVRRFLRGAYHTLAFAATGGRGVAASLPRGERVRLLPEYRFVTWNEAEYEAFRAAVRPGAVALDVGANVGAYSLLLGQWVGTGGRVFAFEPAPAAFAGLSRHVSLNRLVDVVVPGRAAVAARSGRARLSVDGLSGANRLDDAGGGAVVATVPGDEFCAARGVTPSFLKIDVEGAELDVLRGARDTIRAAGDSLALFVEMHPTIWREIGISADDLKAELDLQGLDAVPLRPVADPWSLEGECLRLVRR